MTLKFRLPINVRVLLISFITRFSIGNHFALLPSEGCKQGPLLRYAKYVFTACVSFIRNDINFDFCGLSLAASSLIAISGCSLPKSGSIGLVTYDGKIEEYGVYPEDYCKAYNPKAICEVAGQVQPGEILIDGLYKVG